MSTVTSGPPGPPRFDGTPHEISADMFFAMIEAGAFPEESRVYLEDGRIQEKMPKTNAHSLLGAHIPIALNRRLPPGWLAFPESQFKLDRKNSPLPDVAIVRCDDARDFFYQGRRPETRDMGLILDIAVTSLANDLARNLERYARNGVPSYWVADVNGRRMFIHTKPRLVEGRGEYQDVLIAGPGEVFPLILDGQAVLQLTYEDLMFRTVPPPDFDD